MRGLDKLKRSGLSINNPSVNDIFEFFGNPYIHVDRFDFNISNGLRCNKNDMN